MTKQSRFYGVKRVLNSFSGEENSTHRDSIAIESPLTIVYLDFPDADSKKNLVTLLRTPGDEVSLAAGFLLAEGYFSKPQEIFHLDYDKKLDSVHFCSHKKIDFKERQHLMHSGCSSCSLDVLNNLYSTLKPLEKKVIDKAVIQTINEQTKQQPLFDETGGVHASFLYDVQGQCLAMAEDIGRHNALDKAIGHLFLQNSLHKAEFVWLSGRIGFELVQKAINAQINTVIAIGPPTSLAVDFAKIYNLNIIGFNRQGKYVIYHENF